MYCPDYCNPNPNDPYSNSNTYTFLTLGSMVGLGLLGSALALNSSRREDQDGSSTSQPVQRHRLVRTRSAERERPQGPRSPGISRLRRILSVESRGEERLQSMQDAPLQEDQSGGRNRLQRRSGIRVPRRNVGDVDTDANQAGDRADNTQLDHLREEQNGVMAANHPTASEDGAHNDTRPSGSQPRFGNRADILTTPIPQKGRTRARNSHDGRGRSRFEGEEEAIRRSIRDQQGTGEEQEAIRVSLREQENHKREQEAIKRSLHDQEIIEQEEDEQEILLRALKTQEALLKSVEEHQAADVKELEEQRGTVEQLRERLRALEC